MVDVDQTGDPYLVDARAALDRVQTQCLRRGDPVAAERLAEERDRDLVGAANEVAGVCRKLGGEVVRGRGFHAEDYSSDV